MSHAKACSLAICVSLLSLIPAAAQEWKSGIEWKKPKVVDPGDFSKPPADAIVLFDGEDMSAFEGGRNGNSKMVMWLQMWRGSPPSSLSGVANSIWNLPHHRKIRTRGRAVETAEFT